LGPAAHGEPGDAVRHAVEVGPRVVRSQPGRLGRVRDEQGRQAARLPAVRRGMMRALPTLLAVLASCGAGGDESPDTFLAFSTTFAPFRGWAAFASEGPPDNGRFPPDVLGPRTQYLNRRPARGAAEFPVGTVIVEARE